MGYGDMFRTFDANGNPTTLWVPDQSSDAVADAIIAKNRKARDMSEARKWQAYARDLEASLKKARAERDLLFIHREAWKEVSRQLRESGVLSLPKEQLNALLERKVVEITQRQQKT